MSEEKEPRSYWEVFYDDVFLLFFLGTAITYIFYTVWGLMELGTASPSPLLKP
ncbi:MAG: hypothetical protein OEZ32_01755 [Nitrospinota bacterium]|nr:hypothetical protein [Nitrospinota bacterium]